MAATTVPRPDRLPAVLTRPEDSLAWMLPDLSWRLLPFAAAVGAVWLARRPAWLGLSRGRLRAQLAFGLAGAPLMFGAAAAMRLGLARLAGRARRAPLVPASALDAALQAAYFLLNAPLEEAFFRGLLQGGLGVRAGAGAGIAVATPGYVLYHRLGRWSWPEVLATALAGVPLALAYRLLPGPPSLLGVSIAHAGATCGFLGPGPWVLHRLGLL